MNPEVLAIALLCAFSCSVLGVFLVLKNLAMISDALSHTILLGIVLAFFVVHSLSSPWLLIAAALVGLLSAYMIECLKHTRLIQEDSAIALTYSFFFSIAIILISVYASKVHIDTDMVLLGSLALAPLSRTDFLGFDLASGIVVMGFFSIINVLFVWIFYKELVISCFDRMLALSLRMKPDLVHYIFVTLVSFQSVASFEAVGSILVISFMVGPPLCAYMLVKTLKAMLVLSSVFAVFDAFLGVWLATVFDLSIAGLISMVIGINLIIVLLAKRLSKPTLVQKEAATSV